MKKMQFDTLTAAELKQLLEQINPDGRIDTVPELLKFLGEIPENTSLLDYIQAHSVDPEAVDKAVDDKIDSMAKEAYDVENERLYLFGRPKEEPEPEPEPDSSDDNENDNLNEDDASSSSDEGASLSSDDGGE